MQLNKIVRAIWEKEAFIALLTAEAIVTLLVLVALGRQLVG